MKEIICQNNNCKYNFLNHCIHDKPYLRIDNESKCAFFEKLSNYKKRIKATMQTESKADLKDAEKVASKREIM